MYQLDVKSARTTRTTALTFAPTARLTSVRTCLALAARRSEKVYQLDVKSARTTRTTARTFAPTARLTSVRTCLALAARRSEKVYKLDVKSAYLNATLEEDIYLEQPELFEKKGSKGEKLFCHLLKSIYGLKQAGREWNCMLDKWLISHGQNDPCLYISCDNKPVY